MFRHAAIALAILAASSLADPPAPAPAQEAASSAPRLRRVRPSGDGSHFVLEGTDDRFFAWGVNYDHNADNRLLEDYWEKQWDAVVGDFREIKALGVNLVRVHLQVGRFMKDADHPDEANLGRLAALVRLAEENGLYLDLTGLGCYDKAEVPAWYAALDEPARWDVQVRFWKAVAGVGRGHASIFCYDLMNEPIVSGGEPPKEWLPGPAFAGKHFIQRISIDPKGRKDEEVARAWVAKLASAIREVDDRAMLTIGVINWATIFPGARPMFYSPEVGKPLDFVGVHIYPRKGQLDADLVTLAAHEVGKPILIEEIFPLSASVEETEAFIRRSKSIADGWVSFYWGRTIEECERKGDFNGTLTAAWLRRFRALASEAAKP